LPGEWTNQGGSKTQRHHDGRNGGGLVGAD
jgi:hypothetical protein